MTDQNQPAAGYTGGFAFGPTPAQTGQSTGQTAGQAQPAQATPPPPPPVAAPVAPIQAAPVPVAPAPMPAQTTPPPPPPPPPAYDPTPPPPPPPAAPLGGMGVEDPMEAQGEPEDPNYKFGERMKTFTTTVKLPAHELKFDENYFLNLLAGSISLSKDEKLRIIESTPKLRQEQIDELIRIFEEEREKFLELSAKHATSLKKLEAEHAADWMDIEISLKSTQKAQEDQSKADDIRKQLGL